MAKSEEQKEKGVEVAVELMAMLLVEFIEHKKSQEGLSINSNEQNEIKKT